MSSYKILLIVALFYSIPALSEDISVVSGVYRSSAVDGGISETETSIGLRYGLKVVSKSQWFVQAKLSSTSYSGDNAPDGGSGFQVGGGQKYFYRSFSNRITPYLYWLALFINDNTASNTTETSSQGIFYGGHAGIKFNFDKSIFVEFGSTLFFSALNSTVTVKNSATGDEVKTTRTELYVSSIGDIQSMTISLGYVL